MPDEPLFNFLYKHATPIGLMLIFVIALARGVIVFSRELVAEREERAKETAALKEDRDFWKDRALQLINTTDRSTQNVARMTEVAGTAMSIVKESQPGAGNVRT